MSVDLTIFPEAPTPTKVLFPKVTPRRTVESTGVTALKDDPLSVDLTIFPEAPTPTKILFPKVTPRREFEVREVTVL